MSSVLFTAFTTIRSAPQFAHFEQTVLENSRKVMNMGFLRKVCTLNQTIRPTICFFFISFKNSVGGETDFK